MAAGNPQHFLSNRQWKIRTITQMADVFPPTAEIFDITDVAGQYHFTPADPSLWRDGFASVPLNYTSGEALLALPPEPPGTAGFNAAVAGKEFFTGPLTLRNADGSDSLHTLWLWVVTDYMPPPDNIPYCRTIAYVSHGGPGGLNHAGHVHADD